MFFGYKVSIQQHFKSSLLWKTELPRIISWEFTQHWKCQDYIRNTYNGDFDFVFQRRNLLYALNSDLVTLRSCGKNKINFQGYMVDCTNAKMCLGHSIASKNILAAAVVVGKQGKASMVDLKV